MGNCCSCRKSKDDEDGREVDAESAGDQAAFKEKEKRRSLEGEGASGDGKKQRRRRQSSGLSRYSKDGRHVIEKPFSIAAFNVQRFGVSKMSDPEVVNVLVKVVQLFDVILIEEVVDVSGKSLKELLQQINQRQPLGAGEYDMIVSDRVGRGAQKEQYAVFFKKEKVQILESLVYHDPGDKFEREPFIVRMSCESVPSEISQLVLICIHTQPKSANAEIDLLYEVHHHVAQRMNAENIVIMGDFNASGAYIKSQDWEKNRLRGDAFKWLIPDHMDTTATNTLAAYDRIVVSGDALCKALSANTGSVLRYDETFDIGRDVLLKVSDHYPVWFTLKSVAHPTIERFLTEKVALVVEDRRCPDIDPKSLLEHFKLSKIKASGLYNSGGDLIQVELKSQKFSRLADLENTLTKLREQHRNLLSYSSYAALKHQVEGVGKLAPGLTEEEKGKYVLLLILDFLSSVTVCKIEIKTGLI